MILSKAGIPTFSDEEEGSRIYASLRGQWEPDANRLARAMLYDPAELDPPAGDELDGGYYGEAFGSFS